MILTTHLMEEAEILSDRIGIITQGSLKCIGTQYKLKKLYGKGFKLTLYGDEQTDRSLLISTEANIKKIEGALSRIIHNFKIFSVLKYAVTFEVIY